MSQWILEASARVTRCLDSPRSYTVMTNNGNSIRQNRRHLLKPAEPDYLISREVDFPEVFDDISGVGLAGNPAPAHVEPQVVAPQNTGRPRAGNYVTRAGRAVRPPNRMDL